MKRNFLVLAGALLSLALALAGCPDSSGSSHPMYKVTFDADGGSPGTQTRTVYGGDSVGAGNMPANPSRDGYAFGGWYTQRNGGGTQFAGSTPVNANITVYAKWGEAGGDSSLDSALVAKWYMYPAEVDDPEAEPAFEITADGRLVSEANTNGEITVTTSKGVISATVALNGQTVESGTADYTVAGDTLLLSNPKLNGYTGGIFQAFVSLIQTAEALGGDGHYHKGDGGGTDGEKCTVTFNADGGSPATQTKTVNNGASVGTGNMPSNPTKSGYSFGGWWTERDGGGTEFTATTTVYADVTVYAKWTESAEVQYTITFNLDGGNIDGDGAERKVFVESGASVGGAMPSNPTKSDYSFGGWYTEQNGGGTAFAATTTVYADVTVYAKWTESAEVQYTITFNLDGGNIDGDGAERKVFVESGASVGGAMPSNPTKSDYSFGGWYTEQNGGGTAFAATTTVYADVTVYAKWVVETVVPASTLQAALSWLANNAVEGGEYTIPLSATESIGPQQLSYSGKTVSIRINGDDTEREVRLSSIGALFAVGSGVTLTLGNNVTLQGRSGNTSSLVLVSSGGTLVMESGAKITGNTSSSSSSFGGGGVRVSGTFTMNGGEISGNTASSSTTTSSPSSFGGGVYVAGGTFEMSGGAISGNTASSSTSSSPSSSGGGVYVADGTFEMSGGEISGNTASSSTYSSTTSSGGGVYVASAGTFTKESGGIIYGSDASATLKNAANSNNDGYGHAVYVGGSGSRRNSTAGEGVTLDSLKSGAAGGWVETVTFDADGGSPASQTVTVNSGESVGSANMPTEPTKSGYSFGGWWTKRDGGGTKFTATTTVTTGVIVYAKWILILGSVQISLQTGTDASALTNTTIAVNDSAQFSVDSGYSSYIWYWDGEEISGETSSTYTLEAASKPAGIYELSVFVTTGTGKLLSARCRVTITNGTVGLVFTYSSVSGGEWTLLSDGRRQSPATAHNGVTKARISFTSSTVNESVSIQLDVSSEQNCDYAFISELDNASATYDSGYYTGSRISGEQTVTITIPVPTAGAHFIDIGYSKDRSAVVGSDCAWFKVIN